MEKKNPVIITTADGSHSVSLGNTGITFHSVFGAYTESQHIFIEAGLRHYLANRPVKELSVFEMGFGTGLNAFLSAIQAGTLKIRIRYIALDLFPLEEAVFRELNYGRQLGAETLYRLLMQAAWGQPVAINDFFILEKQQADLLRWQSQASFDLCFFDAFAPEDQPELWTEQVFVQLKERLKKGGVLTTYCSKSVVRKALMQAGFKVEKLKGPPGKREILRATASP
ncbi:hypothetical protein A8C56_14645 [Niabella ginsenosidivorans]|uniref:MnmC-like methyltransferase domain-containing protein n=1 Tax=Niabella ginsenosidivorans TaxID=1176587 RepID=A0A1A9I3E1_9BACT|nr:tRNA (5-methylaminomethyl-2-thiouridine)(34)-methyltransferase MnmD [Niabella ginsenosidivorans]ANH82043.1 hypothetical protein A8C56_14645 [Niabella ginsenosidivorans]